MSFRLDNTANANQKATKGVNRFFLLHFWLAEFFFLSYLFTVGVRLIDFKSAKATKSLRNNLSFLLFEFFQAHLLSDRFSAVNSFY